MLKRIAVFACISIIIFFSIPSFALTWAPTVGSMAAGRVGPTATLLPNGKVLITGGFANSGDINPSVELFNPLTGTFETTGNMNDERVSHTATLLPNGKVLIAGGNIDSSAPVYSAELYDPSNGTFSYTTGSMNVNRALHTATLLQNGKVLIAGGYDGSVGLSSAELYDPDLDTFTSTNHMNQIRENHTATLLPNGKVLMAGGYDPASGGLYKGNAELYDPLGGTFTPTNNGMSFARENHTATLLPNGTVLIAGGDDSSAIDSAELFITATGTFTVTNIMNNKRESHTSTLLPNGKVLIAGGYNRDTDQYLSSAEMYDLSTGTFTSVGPMTTARAYHAATLLPDGSVLMAGGKKGTYSGDYLSSAELLDPSSGTFESAISMSDVRACHTATLLPNGKVLVAGGDGPLSSADLFNPSSGSFSPNGYYMKVARRNATGTLLANGKVLITGGGTGGGYTSSAELYDPASEQFSLTGSMEITRSYHTAILLANGKVLIAGGSDGTQYTPSAEVYDPYTGKFSRTKGDMTFIGESPAAILLPSGKVLIAGGQDTGTLSDAELYNPSTGTFEAIGTMKVARSGHTMTLLPSGKVLIAGGANNTAELYDPITGVFSYTTGNMLTIRKRHTAILLPSGKVLIAGGVNASVLSSVELYDPATGTFSSADAMGTGRDQYTATLLVNGKILMVGGWGISEKLSSAELVRYTEYDYASFGSAMQPSISIYPSSIQPNTSSYSLTGLKFKGTSEASGGNGPANSPTNYPRTYLQGIQSGRLIDVSTTEYPISSWQNADTSISFATPADLQGGHYLLTVMANSVPSDSKIVYYQPPQEPPSAPVGLVTTNITLDSMSGYAFCTWEAMLDATSYTISYGTNEAATNLGSSTTTDARCQLPGLPLGGTYYWKVSGTNSSGMGPYSSIISFTLRPRDFLIHVDWLGARVTTSEIEWAWDNVDGEDGYLLMNFPAYLSQHIYLPANITSTVEKGLATNTMYSSIVFAYNAGGSGESNIGGCYTLAATPDAPSVVGSYDAVNGYNCKITVNPNGNPSWTFYAVTSDEGVTWVQADGTTGSGPDWQAITSWTQKSLMPSTIYTYEVKAMNGDNKYSGKTTSLSLKGSGTTPPAAPLGLVTTNVTTNSARCSWDAVLGATLYTVSRGTNVLATNEGIATTTEAVYSWTGLDPGMQYYWKVSATNGNGTGAYSSPVTSFTTIPNPPPAPGDFTGNAMSTTSISWSWDDVVGEDGYVLHDPGYNTVIPVPADTTMFPEGALAINTLYTREVNAYNSGGSAESNIYSRYTLAASPDVQTVSGSYDASDGYHCDITLNPHGNPGWTYYAVTIDNGNTWLQANGTTLPSVSWEAMDHWSHKNLSPDTQYNYKVKAKNGNNIETSLSMAVMAYTPPPAPVGPVTTNITNNSALCTWEFTPGLSYYTISRGTDIMATNEGTATTIEASYMLQGLNPGTRYYWKVSATNPNGTGAYSTIISFETIPFPPPPPQNFIGMAESKTSIRWSWQDVVGEDGYLVHDLDHIKIIPVPADFISTLEGGLAINTIYTREVAAYNAGGTSESLSYSRYTLAATPEAPVVSGNYNVTNGYYCDIGLIIPIGGNPAGTYYAVTINEGTTWLKADGTTTGTPFWQTDLETFDWFHKNLSPNTLYTYKVVAKNGNNIETSRSLPGFDTTPPPAPASPTTTNITNNSARCNWNVVPTSTYTVSRGIDPQATSLGTVTTTDAFYTWTGLDPEMLYYWKVSATNGNGTGAYSTIANFTTLPNPPPAPTGFTGSAMSTTSIMWSWNDVGGETGYRVHDPGYVKVINVPMNFTSTLEGLLLVNMQYTRRVNAYNTGGSAESMTDSKYTLAATPGTPTVSGSYDAVNNYHCDITVNIGGNPGGTYYAVSPDNEMNWLQADGTIAPSAYWNTTLNWLHKNLNPNTMYTYKVKARNGDNFESSLSSGGSGTTPPAAPLGLVTTSVATNAANVTWEAVSGANNYTISWGTNEVATNKGTNITTPPFYSLAGLSPKTTYYWKVSATNGNGTGAYSSIASFETLPNPPSALTFLIATAESSSSIRWSWNDVEREDGYLLFNDWYPRTLIFSMPAGMTSTLETGLAPNEELFVTINAYNISGSSELSSGGYTLAATPDAPTVSGDYDVISGYHCDITVNPNGNIEARYAITTDEGSNWLKDDGTLTTEAFWLMDFAWIQKNLSPNTLYTYKVMAKNKSDKLTSFSLPGSDTTPPASPEGLVTTAVATNSATCTWEAVIGADNYTISWGTNEAATNKGTGNPVSASYPLTGLIPNTTYYWKVSATNGNGTGAFSMIVSFETLPLTPLAPTGFTGTAISTSEILWSWDDVAGEDGYRLFDQDHNLKFSMPAGTTSTIETGLSANALCTREINAYNAGGSAESSGARYTLAATPEAPAVSGGFNFGPGYFLDITVKPNGNPDWTYYAVKTQTSMYVQSSGYTGPVPDWQTTLIWKNVTMDPNTYYYYTVMAMNGDGITTEFSPPGGDTTPPSWPVGLVTTDITTNSAHLSWEAVVAVPPVSYIVYGMSEGAVTTTETSYQWTGLDPLTTYHWSVRATNVHGTGPSSVDRSFTTLTVYTSAPTGFIGTAESPSSIRWSWNDVDNEDGYKLHNLDYSTIVDIPPGITSTLEGGLATNSLYTREVNAYNSYGSADSTSYSRYTLATSPESLATVEVTGSAVKLFWDGTGTRYAVERATQEAGPWIPIVLWGDGLITTEYRNTGLAPVTIYWYRTSAYNGDQVITEPGAPIYTTTLTWEETGAPTIESVWLNRMPFSSGETIYSRNSEVRVRAIDDHGVAAIELYADTSVTDPVLFTLMPGMGNTTFEGTWIGDRPFVLHGEGLHQLRFYARDGIGNVSTTEMTARIMGGGVQMVGGVYNYPNPFKPMSGQSTNIQYTLSVDAPITIIIYDMAGRETKRMKFGSGTNGGRGGVNQVSWNGVTLNGSDIAGNGMYLYKVISGNEVIGSGKIVVFDQ